MFREQTHITKDQNAHEQVWNRKWQGPYKIVKRKYADNRNVYIIRDDNPQGNGLSTSISCASSIRDS